MNNIDEKRQQIIEVLLDYIDSEVAYFPLTNTSPREKFDQALKDYGAIVEQQTRDAVIEECKTALLAEVYKIAGTMDTSWSDVNSAKAHIKLGLEESVNIINALKSKQPKSFFDMSDKEKQDILSQAAKQSNQMQSRLAVKQPTTEEKL